MLSLLLHEAQDAYGHGQRYEDVIKEAEDSTRYISKLQKQGGTKNSQDFLREDHFVNPVREVGVKSVEKVLQHLPAKNVRTFIE